MSIFLICIYKQEIKQFLDEKIPQNTLQQVPSFLDSKGLLSLINIDILELLRPVRFIDGENKIQGYKAEILPGSEIIA